MEDLQGRSRAIVTDRRIWGTTCLLLGWPAFGILAETELLLDSAAPFVYGYLVVLRAVVRDFPADYAFWAGFALYCFGVATLLVTAFDRVRARLTSFRQSNRESTIGE